ncbi:hypothetical protein PCE1_004878 [Barthelona sp. PCE]
MRYKSVCGPEAAVPRPRESPRDYRRAPKGQKISPRDQISAMVSQEVEQCILDCQILSIHYILGCRSGELNFIEKRHLEITLHENSMEQSLSVIIPKRKTHGKSRKGRFVTTPQKILVRKCICAVYCACTRNKAAGHRVTPQ